MYYRVYYQKLPERKIDVEVISSEKAIGTLESVYTYSHNVGQYNYSSGMCATRASIEEAIAALRSNLLKQMDNVKNHLIQLERELNDFDEKSFPHKKI